MNGSSPPSTVHGDTVSVRVLEQTFTVQIQLSMTMRPMIGTALVAGLTLLSA